jgi:L-amino acid N-acyltransferase YncA
VNTVSKQNIFTIRHPIKSDWDALLFLLNDIIDIGGSTAFEIPLSAAEFHSKFLGGTNFVCCYVAQGSSEEILGFQSLTRHPKLPTDWVDIATFAKPTPKASGVGTALFQKSLDYVTNSEFETINATIRADNKAGLGYYSKMGFIDYSVTNAVPLNDGTLIDRISKKLVVRNK